MVSMAASVITAQGNMGDDEMWTKSSLPVTAVWYHHDRQKYMSHCPGRIMTFGST